MKLEQEEEERKEDVNRGECELRMNSDMMGQGRSWGEGGRGEGRGGRCVYNI